MNQSAQQDLSERLETLEVKSAFQEDLIESLNSIVARQQETIRLLEKDIRRLQDSFQDLAENDQPVVDAPPPHY